MGLFEKNQDLAWKLARRARRHLGGSFEDLRTFALTGLWEASKTYEPASGVPFRAYAVPRIRGAILDEARRGFILSRRAKATGAVVVEYNHRLDGHSVSPEELALAKEEYDVALGAMDCLSERERALVEGHYLRGERLDHVSSRLGISKSWGTRIQQAAVGKVTRYVARRERL